MMDLTRVMTQWSVEEYLKCINFNNNFTNRNILINMKFVKLNSILAHQTYVF